MGKWIRRLLEFSYTFVAMNGAAVVGLYAFVKQKNVWVRQHDWEVWESPSAQVVPLPVRRPAKETRKAA